MLFLTEASQAAMTFPAFNNSYVFSQNSCSNVSGDASTSTPSGLIILTTPPLNFLSKMSFQSNISCGLSVLK